MISRPRAYRSAALAALALVGTASAAWAAPPLIVGTETQVATPSGLQPVARDVLVKFVPGTAVRTQRAARSRALDGAGAQPRDARPVPGLPGVWRVPVDAGESPRRVARRLDARRDVQWAAPDVQARLSGVPNDPLFGNLWGLSNTGQQVQAPTPFAGIPGIDIGARGAWATVRGSSDVRVAVVDSGIDMRHPDLAANLRTDGARNFIPDVDGVVDPAAVDDANGHGTHVAGTIGAVGDNALGVTGVNWAVGMVPVRACSFAVVCPEAVAGLAHAGGVARVVNASLGGPMQSPQPSTEAIGRHPNSLYVVAAGNDGADNDANPQDPCNIRLPNVLCVAALGPDGDLASFSNYGARSVHIAAPGVEIQSTVPTFATVFDPGMASDGATPARPLGWTEDRNPVGGTPAWEWVPGGGSPYIVLNRPAPAASLTEWTITAPGSFSAVGDACQMNASVEVDLEPGQQALALGYTAPGDSAVTLLPGSAISGDTAGKSVPWDVDLSGLIGRSGLKLVFIVQSVPGIPGPLVELTPPTVKCVVGQPRVGSYEFFDGTSMATPLVAGAAALLLAKNPDLTAVQVKDAILSTAVRMESLRGKVITGGRLDVNAALAAVPARAQASPPAPPAPPRAGGVVDLRLGSGIAVRPGRWRAGVPVTCGRQVPAGCSVTVALRMRVGRGSSRSPRWIAQGTRRVTVPAGWRGRVDVVLTTPARRLLQRHPRVRTTVIVAGRGESAGQRSVRQGSRLIRR